MISIIVVVSILGIGHKSKLSEEQRQTEEQQIKAEMKRVNQYFKENHNYYLQRIQPYISIGERRVGVKELRWPKYFLVEDDGLVYSSGMDYFPFASKKKAIKIWENLDEKKKENYLVVSQSIVRIDLNSEDEYRMLQNAQKHFEDVAKH